MTRFRVAFISVAESAERWAKPLRAALPEDALYFEAGAIPPEEVDVVLTAAPPPGALAPYTRLKLIQSIWMGVETLAVDPTLPRDVPLARMIDPSMTRAMVESAAAHVLNAHLRLDDLARQQRESRWKLLRSPTTDQRTVGILGMGELGRAVAGTLMQLGFRVRGWSRTPREVEGVESFAGDGALPGFLAGCEILVVLIPLTPQTAGIIDASFLARLPDGAVLINLARGGLVRDDDLLIGARQRPPASRSARRVQRRAAPSGARFLEPRTSDRDAARRGAYQSADCGRVCCRESAAAGLGGAVVGIGRPDAWLLTKSRYAILKVIW